VLFRKKLSQSRCTKCLTVKNIFSLFLRIQNKNFDMAGVHWYLLLCMCVVAFLLKETSCTNEVSKVNGPDRSSKTRKRRFLVYPENGSYAEVITSRGIRHIPKLLQIHWYFSCRYSGLPDKRLRKQRVQSLCIISN
jgi:hypothetical protein